MHDFIPLPAVRVMATRLLDSWSLLLHVLLSLYMGLVFFVTVACGEKRSSMVDGEMRQPHNTNNNNNNNCDNTNKHAQATQHVLSYLDPRTVVELVGQVPEAG